MPRFSEEMDKCERYLNNLRTEQEIRRMSDESLTRLDDVAMYTNKVVVHDSREDTENRFDDESEQVGEEEKEEENEDTNCGAGIVHFGNVGFMNFVDSSKNDNTQNTETNGKVDAIERLENETTPAAVGKTVVPVEETSIDRNKNSSNFSSGRRLFRSPQKLRKSTALTHKLNRLDKIKTRKEKNSFAAKKGFKMNFLTVKFKLSELQVKAGRAPDFALFVKNDVHDPKTVNAANHAGKYMSYVKGDIGEIFYNKGISFDPKKFFMCENAVDLSEDKIGPLEMIQTSVKNTSKNAKKHKEKAIIIQESEEDETTDDTSMQSEDEDNDKESSSSSFDSDFNDDPFNMKKVAKKVSWGAPDHDGSESPGSSGGVIVYGRGAEKSVDKSKKKRKADIKKRSKESNKRTSTDVLESFEPVQKKKKPQAKTVGRSGVGKGRGKRRGKRI